MINNNSVYYPSNYYVFAPGPLQALVPVPFAPPQLIPFQAIDPARVSYPSQAPIYPFFIPQIPQAPQDNGPSLVFEVPDFAEAYDEAVLALYSDPRTKHRFDEYDAALMESLPTLAEYFRIKSLAPSPDLQTIQSIQPAVMVEEIIGIIVDHRDPSEAVKNIKKENYGFDRFAHRSLLEFSMSHANELADGARTLSSIRRPKEYQDLMLFGMDNQLIGLVKQTINHQQFSTLSPSLKYDLSCWLAARGCIDPLKKTIRSLEPHYQSGTLLAALGHAIQKQKEESLSDLFLFGSEIFSPRTQEAVALIDKIIQSNKQKAAHYFLNSPLKNHLQSPFLTSRFNEIIQKGSLGLFREFLSSCIDNVADEQIGDIFLAACREKKRHDEINDPHNKIFHTLLEHPRVRTLDKSLLWAKVFSAEDVTLSLIINSCGKRILPDALLNSKFNEFVQQENDAPVFEILNSKRASSIDQEAIRNFLSKAMARWKVTPSLSKKYVFMDAFSKAIDKLKAFKEADKQLEFLLELMQIPSQPLLSCFLKSNKVYQSIKTLPFVASICNHPFFPSFSGPILGELLLCMIQSGSLFVPYFISILDHPKFNEITTPQVDVITIQLTERLPRDYNSLTEVFKRPAFHRVTTKTLLAFAIKLGKMDIDQAAPLMKIVCALLKDRELDKDAQSKLSKLAIKFDPLEVAQDIRQLCLLSKRSAAESASGSALKKPRLNSID